MLTFINPAQVMFPKGLAWVYDSAPYNQSDLKIRLCRETDDGHYMHDRDLKVLRRHTDETQLRSGADTFPCIMARANGTVDTLLDWTEDGHVGEPSMIIDMCLPLVMGANREAAIATFLKERTDLKVRFRYIFDADGLLPEIQPPVSYHERAALAAWFIHGIRNARLSKKGSFLVSQEGCVPALE